MTDTAWHATDAPVPAHVRDRRRAKGVALLVLVAVLVLLAWQRPNPFADPQTITARFADAGALASVGAEVRIAGTPVGEVVGRRRDGALALVTMELDEDAGVVHRDARAELRPRLLFEGTAYVDLSPGSPGSPPLGEDPIPVGRTRTAVSTADAVALLDAPTRTALRTDVRELARTLKPGTAAEANAALAAVPPLVQDAGTVAAAARGASGDGLRRSVAGLAATTRTLSDRSDDLVAAAQGAGAVADAATTAADDALDGSLATLPATLASVRSGGDAAAAVLDRVGPVAAAARPAARRLAPTLAAARPLLREAVPALERTAPLVADARGTLADAARAAGGARATLREADAVVKTFDGGLLTALERPTALGTPAYLSFLGLFAGGGGASRAFVPGEGHFMRFGLRFLTGAGAPVPPCSLLDRAAPQLAEQLARTGGCQR